MVLYGPSDNAPVRQYPVFLVEPVQQSAHQARVAPVVRKKDSVSHKVSNLKESSILHAGKVRYVTQVSKNAPASTKLPKAFHPYFCAFIEPSL